jgi:hypothetical protein
MDNGLIFPSLVVIVLSWGVTMLEDLSGAMKLRSSKLLNSSDRKIRQGDVEQRVEGQTNVRPT